MMMVVPAIRPAFVVVVVVMMVVGMIIRLEEGGLDFEDAVEIEGVLREHASSGTFAFTERCSFA